MAAGEVIDSPSAVVRELMENAIDAKATRITVSIWIDQWKIQVTDNGSGISFENLKIIAKPHCTSKILYSDDLSKINTLGFRGEALHSMTQVADLELFSSTQDLLTEIRSGWHAVYSNALRDPELQEVAIAPGTTVQVNNLFKTWESRRTSGQTLKQHLKKIQQCIHDIALAHPHLTIQVNQDDREWFVLSTAATLTMRLLQVLPTGEKTDFREVKTDRLHLVVGLPDRISRRQSDWMRVAINGRFVDCPELLSTITHHLRRMLPRDRYPIAIAHLTLPPDNLDWNRHPAKQTLYLQHLDFWQTLLGHGIEEALYLDLNQSSTRATSFIKAAEQRSGYSTSRSINPDSTQPNTAQSAKKLPHGLIAIAQVRNTYILAEHGGGMYLIEQHIAHERVLYEQICLRWQLVPVKETVMLRGLSARQVEQLEKIGIEIEEFGEDLWAVRSVPELLLPRGDLPDALLELSRECDLQGAQVAIACRTAIRNGTPLDLQAIQCLLDQWQLTTNPHTCPHGRPIYLVLEESSLARFFRRQWVIGKSHGL
ncbi:MAG: DNA mismatch repair endonuclease MutL [Alkalinema sp. FL-bin-369]|nr:DNA mismatch repair endonuclease MutL [Leptolyngbyaceae cyanobacterium LF-bin-369]